MHRRWVPSGSRLLSARPAFLHPACRRRRSAGGCLLCLLPHAHRQTPIRQTGYPHVAVPVRYAHESGEFPRYCWRGQRTDTACFCQGARTAPCPLSACRSAPALSADNRPTSYAFGNRRLPLSWFPALLPALRAWLPVWRQPADRPR